MIDSNKVTCPTCRGAGVVPDGIGGWDVCRECNSLGEITRKHWWKIKKRQGGGSGDKTVSRASLLRR